MPTVITTLTKEEAKEFVSQFSVERRMPPELKKRLEADGWVFGEYDMEKIYKGYPLVIEFCIGDFCAYPCSKNNHWLLEKKNACDTWFEAYVHIINLQERIDNGEHWTGEND